MVLELEDAASAKKQEVANFNKSPVGVKQAEDAAFLEECRKEEQEELEKAAAAEAANIELIAKVMRHCSDYVLLLTRFQIQAEDAAEAATARQAAIVLSEELLANENQVRHVSDQVVLILPCRQFDSSCSESC